MLCCIFRVPVERLSAVRWRKPFEERKQTGNTDYGAHDVVHVGGVDNHVGPMVAVLSKEDQSVVLWISRGRGLTWLFLQSHFPRVAKGHFTHDVKGHIVELLDNVDSPFAILALDAANRVQELISTAYQDVFIPNQVGHAEGKAEYPPHP